jgi:hypothetical protein
LSTTLARARGAARGRAVQAARGRAARAERRPPGPRTEWRVGGQRGARARTRLEGTRAARGRAARREGARCVTRARGARCGVARREGARRVLSGGRPGRARRGDRARGRAARARREGARAARGFAVMYIKMTLYQNDPGGPPAVSSLACARIVVVTQDLDCPTTGCARRTRPVLKPSQRAPYYAVKVETETSRHLVARAPERCRSNTNTVTACVVPSARECG